MDFQAIARETLLTESRELTRAAECLDDSISQTVELVYQAKGKLIVMGVGKSGLVGSKIAATLASTGTPSFFLHPTEAMHGDLGMIGQGDVVLGISYSGESEELTSILPHLKRFTIPLIAMSRNPDSTLARYADIFMSIHVNLEACPLDSAPTCSTTLTMALGDALAVCLMKKRNFRQEDFASLHPGGSLGKKLFVKASDMMRQDNLPIVSHETSLKDAIFTMTEGRLGNVLITDTENRLVAILSDGDLRRALMREDFNLEAPALTFATQNPKVCGDLSILASDALLYIEKHKIQILVLTDLEKKVQGILHIHDLVEAGIKT